MLNRTDFSKSIKLYGAKTFWIFFLFHASCTFYMVEFFHEIIQYLVNVNIKLKLQIWISRYPCFNVVRTRNKTSLLTINWSLYWVKDDAITKKLLKKHYQVGTFCKNSTSWVFTQNIPRNFFFYIIYNLTNIFPFINNIYMYIRK